MDNLSACAGRRGGEGKRWRVIVVEVEAERETGERERWSWWGRKVKWMAEAKEENIAVSSNCLPSLPLLSSLPPPPLPLSFPPSPAPIAAASQLESVQSVARCEW